MKRRLAPARKAGPFADYIDTLVERYGTATLLAEMVGMSLSAFQRGVAGGSLGVGKCLQLAKVVGDSPSEVLRLADKGDVADLIEELYAKSKSGVSATDRKLLALEHDVKEHLLRFVDALKA